MHRFCNINLCLLDYLSLSSHIKAQKGSETPSGEFQNNLNNKFIHLSQYITKINDYSDNISLLNLN